MKVSVVITNYNYGRYLGRAIQSAQSQKFMDGDVEIIVVDDGSTDSSLRVIDAYKEGVRIIRHETNLGLPAAINSGIRASRGMYVIRLDADDWLNRYACFFLSFFMDQNKDIGFVWPDYHIADQNERIIDRVSGPQGAGVMFRKLLLVDVGLYDEEMLSHEDKDILIRSMQRLPGYHLRIPLYRYYRHDANMTSNGDLMAHYEKRLQDKHSDVGSQLPLELNPGLVAPGWWTPSD